MNKIELIPILIITPFFAPQSHAAMFRVHKLVKYLPEYGYKPIVLTTDINYLYNNNERLLSELPECVEIIRTRHIEPSLRGARMAAGGKDRTFSVMKSSYSEKKIENRVGENNNKPNIFKKIPSNLYSYVLNYSKNMPDEYWLWSKLSYSKATALIKEHNIKIMYTTANPYSHLGLAIKLKEQLGLKWLADFRDPCGYGYKNSVSNYFGHRLEKKLLNQTFAKADKITGLSETYSSIFSDLYKLNDDFYTFIPTGSDEAYLPQTKEMISTYSESIVFSGEVMPEQEAYIFEVIQQLHLRDKSIKMIFIGRSEINKPIIDKLLRTIDNWSIDVSYIDHLPQQELYNILHSAKACILAPGINRYWWTNFAKMVDYIALGVPVIADVPKLSEARKELSRAGLGFFLERDDPVQDASRLHSWLENMDRNDPGTDYRNRYLAKSQTRAFASLFDKLQEETAK